MVSGLEKLKELDEYSEEGDEVACQAFKCLTWFYELGMKSREALTIPANYLSDEEVILALGDYIKQVGEDFPENLLTEHHCKLL